MQVIVLKLQCLYNEMSRFVPHLCEQTHIHVQYPSLYNLWEVKHAAKFIIHTCVQLKHGNWHNYIKGYVV